MSFDEYIALDGRRGTIVLRVRRHPRPTHAAVLIYGYGDRATVDRLAAAGATVVVPVCDPAGGAEPDGTPAGVTAEGVADYAADYAADLHTVMQWAVSAHPRCPVLMIGHPTGAPITTRYAESYDVQLAVTPI